MTCLFTVKKTYQKTHACMHLATMGIETLNKQVVVGAYFAGHGAALEAGAHPTKARLPIGVEAVPTLPHHWFAIR